MTNHLPLVRLHPARPLLVFLLATLMGCASVPLASPAEDARAKTASVAEDRALIYLYRNESFGSALLMTVEMDGKPAGETGPHTYFVWEVEPGEHVISTYTNGTEERSTLTLDIEAGYVYYIWQEVKMGMIRGYPLLHQVSSTEGHEGVADCELVHAFYLDKRTKRAPAAAAPQASPTTAAEPARPLFERLGGKAALTAIVDEFAARLARDSRIQKRFAGMDMTHFKAMLVDKLCEISGGPCRYTGRDRPALYRGMGVTQAEFDAFMEDLRDSLNHFQIRADDQTALIKILEPLRSEIVGQ